MALHNIVSDVDDLIPKSPFVREGPETLKENNIPSMVYYPRCLHQQPVFSDLGYGEGSFPVAEKAAGDVLSLPLHPWMTDEEQAEVIEVVLKAAKSVAAAC